MINSIPLWEQYLSNPSNPSARIDPDRWNTEFVRRIPVHQRIDLIEKIDALDYVFTDADLDALTHRHSNAPVFSSSSDDIPYLILQAYLENKIDSHSASHALLRWACENQVLLDRFFHANVPNEMFRYAEYPLIEDGQVQLDGLKILELHLKNLFPEGRILELSETLQKMHQETPYKTRFFAISRKKDPLLESIHTVMEAWIQGPFVLKLMDGAFFSQLILPPDLLHSIYSFQYGPQAIVPTPVLGYFSKEKLSDYHQRVVSIPFPRNAVFYPPRIHEHQALPLSAYLHDANYHCLIESANPDRGFWTKLALSQGLSEEFRRHLLDRELLIYAVHSFAEDQTLEPSDRFWLVCGVCARFAKDNLKTLSENFISLWNSSLQDRYPIESLERCITKLENTIEKDRLDIIVIRKKLTGLLPLITTNKRPLA